MRDWALAINNVCNFYDQQPGEGFRGAMGMEIVCYWLNKRRSQTAPTKSHTFRYAISPPFTTAKCSEIYFNVPYQPQGTLKLQIKVLIYFCTLILKCNWCDVSPYLGPGLREYTKRQTKHEKRVAETTLALGHIFYFNIKTRTGDKNLN